MNFIICMFHSKWLNTSEMEEYQDYMMKEILESKWQLLNSSMEIRI